MILEILDYVTDAFHCKACGELYPRSTLITMSGYQGGNQITGKYCVECAKEIIEDDEE